MFKTISMIQQDSRIYHQWFAFVGRALVSQGIPRSVEDLATTFCESGQMLEGRVATPDDRSEVVKGLTQSLPAFEAAKLVTGQMEDRYTQHSRFYVPERVAELTPKGVRVLKLPAWRIELLFQRLLVGLLVRQAWKPFAGAVAVAGTVVGVLKLFLFWRSEQAAIAGALAGIAVLLGHYWQGRT